MQFILQTLVGGIGLGAIYVLVALGFSLVYRTMGLVNFAHGDILMVGAYLAATFYISAKLPFWVSIIIAIVATAVIGLVIERILRPLENKDFDLMLIGTIGFGIMLEGIAILVWGTTGEAVPTPVGGAPFELFGIFIQRYQLVVVVVAALAAFVLWLFLDRTKSGIAMQAVAINHEEATALGINVGRSNAIAFAIGSGLAALGGGLAGPVLYVSPTFGASLGIMGFSAAILGGFGNIKGAIVGGLAFGILYAFASGLAQGYADLVAFVAFALIVIIRPTGIFGESTVNRA
ncbi:branched-chain amino acid ABC transporter permease [Microbacterium elymi]|uniref:Branched-chain amino acid ABC transporter permease n=1 Tax=Microbacterium elymi TaxID=2909587 RepID=A0ABY5NM49_9MICO|nr:MULTISPECIES: branched-chain amino acid ABC transporter permease [Microbacterium]UUT36181.1 branched-chain amino acid ABC transporter permease [Microbacterium elymi]